MANTELRDICITKLLSEVEFTVIPWLKIAQRLSSSVTMCLPILNGTFLWPGRLLKQKASAVLQAAVPIALAMSFLYGGGNC